MDRFFSLRRIPSSACKAAPTGHSTPSGGKPHGLPNRAEAPPIKVSSTAWGRLVGRYYTVYRSSRQPPEKTILCLGGATDRFADHSEFEHVDDVLREMICSEQNTGSIRNDTLYNYMIIYFSRHLERLPHSKSLLIILNNSICVKFIDLQTPGSSRRQEHPWVASSR